MPWEIKVKEGKSCVVKESSGEVKKCYPDKKDAVAYLRALYANVPEAKGKKR